MNRESWVGGFLFVLGVVLVILKLAGAVAWPWWVVFIPWAILIGIGLSVGLVFAIFAIVITVAATRRRRKQARRG